MSSLLFLRFAVFGFIKCEVLFITQLLKEVNINWLFHRWADQPTRLYVTYVKLSNIMTNTGKFVRPVGSLVKRRSYLIQQKRRSTLQNRPKEKMRKRRNELNKLWNWKRN